MLGAAGNSALNLAAVPLNLVLVFLLSRLLGPSDYGAYASATAWALILSLFAVLGLGPLVVRQIATYQNFDSWELIRGLLRRSNQSVAISSAATMAVGVGIGLAIYGTQPELLYPYWIALLFIPLIAFATIRQAAMQGFGRVVLGRAPEVVVAPLLCIALAAAAAMALRDDFNASWAVAMNVTATLCAFILGLALLRRTLPSQVRAATPAYDSSSWRRSGISLAVLNILMVANAQVGTILLGVLSSPADAGVFNVATRATMFISFFTLAVSYPLMPVVARLYANHEIARLQSMLVRTARGVLLCAAPIGVVLVVFASTILGLFGSGFTDGATAMRILAVGEMVNVITGFGAVVLLMTGRESGLTRCVAVGAALNVGLSVALIPALDVSGAAIGTATGVTCSNLLMTRFAWRRLRIWTAVVGRRAAPR